MDDSVKSFWAKEISPGTNMISLVVERYGPFAFGIVLLLIVWQMIAQPQIESARIDFEQQRALVKELGEVATSFKAVSEQQSKTADVLRSTAELLAKTATMVTENKN